MTEHDRKTQVAIVLTNAVGEMMSLAKEVDHLSGRIYTIIAAMTAWATDMIEMAESGEEE